MGVSWGADVLSWAAGGPKELWYLTDIINTLQGLFIFIVIGCQPQVCTIFYIKIIRFNYYGTQNYGE